MSHEDALRFFIKNQEPKAIVLKGDWGVGKTFYWKKKVIPEHFSTSSLRHKSQGYSYASLYGTDSAQQLKNALAFSYIENSRHGPLREIWRVAMQKLRLAFKFLDSYFGDEATLGYKGSNIKLKAKLLLNDAAFLSIKKSLICIDDVERRSRNLSINDILGLVNYLVDQRECRVIVILNYNSLSEEDKLAWDTGKDKTFVSEISFAPSLAESVEIGLKGSELQPWHSTVKDCLLKLEIKNVRVVAGVKSFVHQITSSISKSASDIHADALNNIVMTATLLAAAHASRGSGAPPILEILASPPLLGLDDEEEGLKQERTKQQEDWLEKIASYGLYFGDDVDRAIAFSIIDGYPRMDLLNPALKHWLAIFQKQQNSEKFSRAWRIYHDTLKDNGEEVFSAFMEAIPGILDFESVHNIESTGRILRVVGHPTEATRLFEDWINIRKTPERIGELDGREHFGYRVQDEEFLEFIGKAKAEVQPRLMPLKEALEQLDSGAVSHQSVISVATSSPTQILAILMGADKDWRTCMKLIVDRGLPGESGDIARMNFLEAIRLISAQSRLNADRVRNKVGEIDFEEELRGFVAP